MNLNSNSSLFIEKFSELKLLISINRFIRAEYLPLLIKLNVCTNLNYPINIDLISKELIITNNKNMKSVIFTLI